MTLRRTGRRIRKLRQVNKHKLASCERDTGDEEEEEEEEEEEKRGQEARLEAKINSRSGSCSKKR